MLRSNTCIIFCDICCFSPAILLPSSAVLVLIRCCKLLSFSLIFAVWEACPVWAFSVCMSSGQIVQTQQSYDVTSIFQCGSRDVALLFPISFLVTSLNNESRNLTFLNTLLRYYCFRFLETNVRHVASLPPVPIFIFASSWP